MAKSLNRATLIGNLGKDPELRTTGTGTSVCSFSLATSDSYKDKSGEWKETTDWHNIVLWDKLAEIANEYLSKGRKVYIEGRIKNRSYEGKDGVTRYISEVVAQTMIMLDGKSQSGGGDGQSYSRQQKSDVDQTSPSDHLAPDFGSDSSDDDEVPF